MAPLAVALCGLCPQSDLPTLTPPITQVYTRRPKGPTDPSSTSTTLASPDDPIADVPNVADESEALPMSYRLVQDIIFGIALLSSR